MGCVVVDLKNSTVDGKKVMPRVAELVYCLVNFPDLKTPDLIAKVYGPCEPDDADNCIKQIAYHARQAGINVRSMNGRYIIAEIELRT